MAEIVSAIFAQRKLRWRRKPSWSWPLSVVTRPRWARRQSILSKLAIAVSPR